MKLTSNKIFSFMLAAAFALTLAGCGGGGGGAAMDDDMEMVTPEPTLTPEEMCAEENGRFEDDGMCTSAEDVAAEIADKKADATKSANTKTMAINAEGMQTDDAGIGGSGVTELTMAISRDSDGTKVTFTDTRDGFMADDDPQFEDQMAGLPDAGGFAGTMHVRKNNDMGEEEVVVVRTDISAPTPTDFGKEGTETSLDLRKDGEAATEDDPNDSMTVEAGADDVNLPKIMAGGFAAATGGSTSVIHTFLPAADDADDETDGDQPRDAAEVMGSFDGASGTYTCNTGNGGANCMATVNAKGEVTDIGTGWIFTPAMGETIDVDDTTYLAYGFWLKRTAQEDGSTKYDEVETFTMAVGVDVTATGAGDNQIGSVTGDASYEGNATGVYVKNVTDNEGAVVTATSGLFSATAKLTANFGGGDIGVNSQFLIEGTLTGFHLQHGEENDWAVKLDSADFSGRAAGEMEAGNIHGNTFSGETIGDSTAAKGDWNGTFYGEAGSMIDHDDDGDTAAVNQAPSAVLGEFNANFTDGTAAGAFGAKKK